MAEVAIAAGDLIPSVVADMTTYPMLRRAIAGWHDCHTMALLMELAHEFMKAHCTPDSVREHMLMLEADRAAE